MPASNCQVGLHDVRVDINSESESGLSQSEKKETADDEITEKSEPELNCKLTSANMSSSDHCILNPGASPADAQDKNIDSLSENTDKLSSSESIEWGSQHEPVMSSTYSWGEIPTEPSVNTSCSARQSDGKPSASSDMAGTSEEEIPSYNTPSSSASSFLSSPAHAVDDIEADDETGVEESEDERCATPPYPVLSSRPVKGESFCACYQNGGDSGLYCTCGEVDSVFEWVWEEKTKSSASFLKQDMREVLFHVDFSCGTAGVRGAKAMTEDQYYWEVKMTTPVYGTDMMVGVGTIEVDMDKYRHMFCSLLGKDGESWGLSYNGFLQHKSLKKAYSSRFGQGTIIGIHLDMWHGTLSFFKNRKPLGVAYAGLQGKAIYPMVCSTAARSGMKVIRCCSFKTSLQFMCCQVLRKIIPVHCDVLEAVKMPPGLRTFLCNNVGWLLQPSPVEASERGLDVGCYRKRNFSEIDDVKEVKNKKMRTSYRHT